MGGKKPFSIHRERGTYSECSTYPISSGVGLLNMGLPTANLESGGQQYGVIERQNRTEGEIRGSARIDQKISELVEVLSHDIQTRLSTSAAEISAEDKIHQLLEAVDSLTTRVYQLEIEASRPLPPIVAPPAGTATYLKDRVATVEGRQSALQSQLAHLTKSLRGSPQNSKHPDSVNESKRISQLERTSQSQGSMLTQLNNHLDQLSDMIANQDRSIADLSQRVNKVSGEQAQNALERNISETVKIESKNRLQGELRHTKRMEELESWLQDLESQVGYYRTDGETEGKLRELHNQLVTRVDGRIERVETQVADEVERGAIHESLLSGMKERQQKLEEQLSSIKKLVENILRNVSEPESMLQDYVSTIAQRVTSVTRQYVSVRIQDNNRLLDATLRARVSEYRENESEAFMMVRPEEKGRSITSGVVIKKGELSKANITNAIDTNSK